MIAALALTLDLGLGVSQGLTVADGFWYQKALPHSTRMTSPAWRAGITVGDRWQVGAHYVDVGVSHMDAWGTSDANYDRFKHRVIKPPTSLDRFVGAGSPNGVSLTVERRAGAFVAGLGAYVYQPHWVETIDGTRYSNNPQAWHVGPSVAIGWQHGPLSVRLDDYVTCLANRCKSERTPGPWGSVLVLSINYGVKR